MSACPDESVMLDLVAGRIPASDTAVRDHLDSCDACKDLVATLARDAAPASAPDRRVGRYTILEEIGRGAMATVYAAHDPELDRKVAIKLVRFHDAHAHADRLLREARAMAKLAHGNVTRVYDVGVEGDAVFVAMELVSGQDLAQWLAVKPRPWREVVAMFASAADGLAAAHREQLIHRDFKPSNVLVGDDGRVLVSDFGLVQSPSADDHELDTSREPQEVALTRTGTIVGTPAYMAPELLAGAAAADELSDQFSFAVALFEALYGVRPFAGDNLDTLRDNVLAGRIVAPPEGREVPRWLSRIVLRGLAPRERRFASMTELARALRADPSRRRRVALVGVGLTALLAGASVVASQRFAASDAAPDPCAAGAAEIARVWSVPRAMIGATVFAGTGLAHAADAWKATAARLDRFADDWTAGYRAACEATRAGTQSGELLDRRMQCLTARRDELAALLEVLAKPDRAVIDRAAQSADALSRVAGCANTVALGMLTAPPADTDAAAIERVRAQVAHVHALRTSANKQPVIAEAERALADAKRLDYAPVTAEAALAVAIVQMVANHPEDAQRALDEALVAAEAGRHLAVKARAHAVGMELDYNGGRYDAAIAKDRLARAALTAIGGDAPLEADMESVLGWIAARRQDDAASELHLRRALELRQRALGPKDLATARAHMNLGTTIGNRGDLAGALAEYETGLAIEREQLGARHPAVAATLGNIAIIDSLAGRHDQAITKSKEALAVLEATMPVEHPSVCLATLQVAGAYHQAEDYANAVTYQRRAVERYERAFGPDHPDVGRALTNLAATLSELGRYPELVEVARRALAIQEKAMGASSPGTATIRHNLATGLVGLGKTAEGLAEFERTLALRIQAYGKDDPRLLSTYLGIAAAHRARKDTRAVIAILGRALALKPHAKSPRDRSLIEKVERELAAARGGR